MAPHIVKNNVEALVAGFAPKGCDQFLIRLVECDGRIRTKIRQRFYDLFISPGGNDTSGTEVLGDLDSKFARHSSRTEDQNCFALLELCAPKERKPRR